MRTQQFRKSIISSTLELGNQRWTVVTAKQYTHFEEYELVRRNQPYMQDFNPNVDEKSVYPQYGFWVPPTDYTYQDNGVPQNFATCEHYDMDLFNNEKDLKLKMAMQTVYDKGWGCTQCRKIDASYVSYQDKSEYVVSTLKVPGFPGIPTHEQYKNKKMMSSIYLIRGCSTLDRSPFDLNQTAGQYIWNQYFLKVGDSSSPYTLT